MTNKNSQQQYEIGMIGLGVMGRTGQVKKWKRQKQSWRRLMQLRQQSITLKNEGY